VLAVRVLLVTRLAAWLRLSRREKIWETAEILILRHQPAVLQRRQPRRPNLDWADRALPGPIPKLRRLGLRLLVTPDTILRWHRDIVRRRGPPGPCVARPAGRRPAGTSGHWSSGWPARTPEWGYRRIHGELAGPGVKVAPSAQHGALCVAFPQGVTCRRYICLGGYCGCAPAVGQDRVGMSGEWAGPYSAVAAGSMLDRFDSVGPFLYGPWPGLHISLAPMWEPGRPGVTGGPVRAEGPRREGRRWRRTATTL